MKQRQYKRWSEEELQELERLRHIMSTPQIAAKLGRTLGSVYTRMNMLDKAHFRNCTMLYSTQLLAEITGRDEVVIRRAAKQKRIPVAKIVRRGTKNYYYFREEAIDAVNKLRKFERIPEAEKTRMIILYREGMSGNDIAKLLNRTPASVYYNIEKALREGK